MEVVETDRFAAGPLSSVANAHSFAPFSVRVKANVAQRENCYSLGMPNFALDRTVAGNIRALRRALGSAVRELSLNDLAGLISEQHPDRPALNATTLRRWESGESEPDLRSLYIMAQLAGVSMEQFAAVGRQAEEKDSPAPGGGTAHHRGYTDDAFVDVPRRSTAAQGGGKKRRQA
jgi:transcriptional regulator with XRE-family HTH domain